MESQFSIRDEPRARLGLFGPVLFGTLAFLVTRFHSSAPSRTLVPLAWWLLPLAVALFGGLWFAGRRLRVSRPAGWLLFALAAALLASNVLLSDLWWSLPRLSIYVADVLLALSVFLLYRDQRETRLPAYLLAITLVHLPFLVDAVVWVMHSGPDFFTKSMRITNFSHVRHFGYLGFLAAVAASALMVVGRGAAVVSVILALAAVFGIVLTGSRGALLSWISFLVFCGFLLPASRRKIAAHGAFVLCAACVLVWILDVTGALVSPNIFQRVRQVMEGQNVVDSGRIEIWLAVTREIAARPLFGFGTEAYQLSGCCDRSVVQPHNFLLQLLMQFGLVGGALLLALGWRALRVVGGIKGLIQRIQCTPEGGVLAAVLLSYLAFASIDGLLYHAAPLVHFALFCGLFAATVHQVPSQFRFSQGSAKSSP